MEIESHAMKLYVWQGVLCDYTCGVAFALAESVDDARRLIIASAPDDSQRGVIAHEIEDTPDIYDTPAGMYVIGGG